MQINKTSANNTELKIEFDIHSEGSYFSDAVVDSFCEASAWIADHYFDTLPLPDKITIDLPFRESNLETWTDTPDHITIAFVDCIVPSMLASGYGVAGCIEMLTHRMIHCSRMMLELPSDGTLQETLIEEGLAMHGARHIFLEYVNEPFKPKWYWGYQGQMPMEQLAQFTERLRPMLDAKCDAKMRNDLFNCGDQSYPPFGAYYLGHTMIESYRRSVKKPLSEILTLPASEFYI